MICKYLFILIYFIVASIGAVSVNDLLLDSSGRPSPPGLPLSEWTKYIGENSMPDDSVGHNPMFSRDPVITSYDVALFRQNARELLLWEFRKDLKKKLFNLGFMQAESFVGSFVNQKYFIMFQDKEDREMAFLLYLRLFDPQQRLDSSFYFRMLHASGDCGKSFLVKYNDIFKRLHWNEPCDLEKISKDNAELKSISPDEIRIQIYNARLNRYKVDAGWFDFTLLNLFPADKVIKDLIPMDKPSSPRANYIFYLVSKCPNIDDQMATLLLPFLTVIGHRDDPGAINFSHQSRNSFMVGMAGKNTILDERIRQVFADAMLSFSDPADIPAVQLLRRGKKEDLLLVGEILEANPESITVFRDYARLFGSQEQAFILWQKTMDAVGKIEDNSFDVVGRRNYRLKFVVQAAIPLLEFKGDMSGESARQIIETIMRFPESSYLYYNYFLSQKKLHPHWAPLLRNSFFAEKKTAYVVIQLATMFPSGALSSEVKRCLLDYYFSTQDNPKLNRLPVDVRNSLLSVDNAELLKVIVEYGYSQNYSAKNIDRWHVLILNGGAKYNPLLLQLAQGEDTEFACKALALIGAQSLLARPCASALIKLADAKETDFTVRIAAFSALAEIGAFESIPLLEKYVKNKNKMVAKAARQALIILKKIESEQDLPDGSMIKPEILKAIRGDIP